MLFGYSNVVAVADSTPSSVFSTPTTTKPPPIKVVTSQIVNEAPAVLSPSRISATNVTSTSTANVIIPQASTVSSSKVSYGQLGLESKANHQSLISKK